MCGIIGYAGNRKAIPVILDSLKRLEYRGYDSAGVAFVDGKLRIFKDKGFIADLEEKVPDSDGTFGIGHTRWATHGSPSRENAHPFSDCKGKIALAHNGIIENYAELRDALTKEGHRFTSQTDTEVLVHLIEKYYRSSLEEAVRHALKNVRGAYAIAVLHADLPGKVVAARNESPLVVGLGMGENFVASDIPALLKQTNRVLYVMDREMVALTDRSVTITDLQGREIKREAQRITWSIEDAEKGGFEHFMLKEIYEAPEAVRNTLLGRVADLELDSLSGNDFDSIKLVACGTSYHAALVGKYIFEDLTHIPASAELASEYRYGAHAGDKPLTILISQSGETADTLGAAREARRRGCRTVAVTNYVGSSLTREADKTFYTRAGLEIGVAASKTFVAQLVALYLMALRIGLDRGTLGAEDAAHFKEDLRLLPGVVSRVLDDAEGIAILSKKYANVRDMFYIGRGISYPVAMEGALKLKEISYVHAEAYAAGELKHGPLALLTPDTPVVALAPRDTTYDKMMGNIGEVTARGSPVLAVATEGDRDIAKVVDDVIQVPRVKNMFTPLPIVVALQLFAYHVARERGCPIDKPRNLAKSVTVE